MGRFRRGKERMEERNEYGRACEQLEHPDPIKARRHPTLFPEKTRLATSPGRSPSRHVSRGARNTTGTRFRS